MDENTEGAIVLRFGQAQTEDRDKVFEAGIRFAWPYPIDEKVEIAREKPVKSDSAWYAAMGAVQIGDNPNQRPVDASRDGYALTQDGKIIHLQAEMIYRVADPSQFAFGYADAVAVLQLVLDNSVTYAASQKDLREIQNNPTVFASSVQQRANDLVDQYDLGVEVVRVTVEAMMSSCHSSRAMPITLFPVRNPRPAKRVVRRPGKPRTSGMPSTPRPVKSPRFAIRPIIRRRHYPLRLVPSTAFHGYHREISHAANASSVHGADVLRGHGADCGK